MKRVLIGLMLLLAMALPAVAQDNAEAAAWEMIRDSADPGMFERFLERYPKGDFSDDARDKLGALTDEGDVMAAPEVAVSVNAQRPIESMNECDHQAADPYDIANPAGYPGLHTLYMDPRLAIPACRQAVAASPDLRYRYLLGRALLRYDSRSVPEGTALMEEAIAGGYSAANVFFAYNLNFTASKTPQARERWKELLDDVAETGNPFGLLSYVGRGSGLATWNYEPPIELTPALLEQLEEMLTRLANAGMPRALATLADIYPDLHPHEGVATAESQYCGLLEKASDLGDTQAIELFALGGGLCSYKGQAWLDLQVDRWTSLINTRADEGNTRVMIEFALMRGVLNEDYQLAYKWLKRAADAGYLEAMYILVSRPDFVMLSEPERGRYLYTLIAAGNVGTLEAFRTGNSLWPMIEPGLPALQQLLKDNGWYSGPVDGQFGPGTKAAIDAAFGSSLPPLL